MLFIALFLLFEAMSSSNITYDFIDERTSTHTIVSNITTEDNFVVVTKVVTTTTVMKKSVILSKDDCLVNKYIINS